MAVELRAFDLGPIMKALLRRRRDKAAFAAGNALRNYRDARSAMHDLLYAYELTNYLRETDPLREEEAKAPLAVRGACLNFAVLLFVRALEPSSERVGLKVLNSFDEAEKNLHHDLVIWRRKGIAHFDYHRPFGDKSVAEDALVVVHERSGSQRIDVADRRMVYQTDLEKRFRALLERAIEAGAARLEEFDKDVQRHLFAITKAEPELIRLITDHPFDPVGFYGEEETAGRFLEHGTPHFEPKKSGAMFDGWPTVGDYNRWNLDTA